MVGSRARVIVAVSSLTALTAAAVLLLRDAETPAPSAADPAAVPGLVPSEEPQRNTESLRAPSLGETAEAATTPPLDKSDAKLLTHLAETSDDPRVVEASLEAISSTYAARSTRKPGPDADLERVLVKHVHAERPTTALAALTAARIALMAEQPREGVTRAIAELAAPEKPAARRYAALDALNLLRPDRRDAHVLTAFERALDAKEPHLVSLALLAVSQSGPSLALAPEANRARFAERVVALLGHYDPGVRGRALFALAEVASLTAASTRFGAGKRGLADREPYVRAQSADLLARCRESAALHLLIEHVADLTPARYELRGWTQLDGKPGLLVHELPGRKRVAEAALFAMQSLSESLDGSPALTLQLGRQPTDEVVLQNAEFARAWYRANQRSIPSDSSR